MQERKEAYALFYILIILTIIGLFVTGVLMWVQIKSEKTTLHTEKTKSELLAISMLEEATFMLEEQGDQSPLAIEKEIVRSFMEGTGNAQYLPIDKQRINVIGQSETSKEARSSYERLFGVLPEYLLPPNHGERNCYWLTKHDIQRTYHLEKQMNENHAGMAFVVFQCTVKKDLDHALESIANFDEDFKDLVFIIIFKEEIEDLIVSRNIKSKYPIYIGHSITTTFDIDVPVLKVFGDLTIDSLTNVYETDISAYDLYFENLDDEEENQSDDVSWQKLTPEDISRVYFMIE